MSAKQESKKNFSLTKTEEKPKAKTPPKKSKAKTPAKKKSTPKRKPQVQRITEKREIIVNATTPPNSPAAVHPGGIPVTDANGNPAGTPHEYADAPNPGGIPNV